jgi:hypothetical protein
VVNIVHSLVLSFYISMCFFSSAEHYNLISLEVKIMQRKGHAWAIGLFYCLEFIVFNLILDLTYLCALNFLFAPEM